jgi:hypothetical protein
MFQGLHQLPSSGGGYPFNWIYRTGTLPPTVDRDRSSSQNHQFWFRECQIMDEVQEMLFNYCDKQNQTLTHIQMKCAPSYTQ